MSGDYDIYKQDPVLLGEDGGRIRLEDLCHPQTFIKVIMKDSSSQNYLILRMNEDGSLHCLKYDLFGNLEARDLNLDQSIQIVHRICSKKETPTTYELYFEALDHILDIHEYYEYLEDEFELPAPHGL